MPPRIKKNPPKRVLKDRDSSLVTNVDHALVYGADLHHIARLRSMNHLAAADVDAAMVIVYANITRLRVGNTRPAHECARGAQASVAAGKAVAYQARTVERVRTNSAPCIGLTQLGVRTAYYAVARNRLALIVVCAGARARAVVLVAA